MSQGACMYVRRSSDRDDHQVVSVESQLEVLQELADQRGIAIREVLTESSTRVPGRPVFNCLLGMIRQGDVRRILVWRLDRLARNMMDGGAIIYELSTCEAKFSLALQVERRELTATGKRARSERQTGGVN